MVELDHVTTAILLAHRVALYATRERWGAAYADHGLVFAREGGNPLDPGAVTKRIAELCAAGVRRVRLHDLRHGAASLRLKAGADISVVSKVLGHSSVAITSDTYAHLLEGVGREAAERAMALVPRASRPSFRLRHGVYEHDRPGAERRIRDVRGPLVRLLGKVQARLSTDQLADSTG
jgi:hypothetical protein